MFGDPILKNSEWCNDFRLNQIPLRFSGVPLELDSHGASSLANARNIGAKLWVLQDFF